MINDDKCQELRHYTAENFCFLAGTRSAMEFYWLPGLPDDVEAMIRGFVI